MFPLKILTVRSESFDSVLPLNFIQSASSELSDNSLNCDIQLFLLEFFRVALLFICQCSVFIAISHLIYDMIPTEKMGFEPMRRC